MTTEQRAEDAPAGPLHRWGRIAVMAIVYYAGARVGALLTIPGTNAGLFWPPAGIALALMMLWGYRVWPGVVIGSAAAIIPLIFGTYSVGRGLVMTAGFLVADAVSLAASVYWLRRALSGRAPFARPREVGAFVLWGALVGSILSATIGTASVAVGGRVGVTALPMVWVYWFVSNVISVLLLGPFFYTWISDRAFQIAGRLPVYAVILASALAATLAVFTEKASTGHHYFEYLTIFFVALAPFAVGLHGSTAVSVMIGLVSILATVANRGPFAAATPAQSVLLLSGYVTTVALVGLISSSLIAERKQSAEEARGATEASAARLRKILDGSPLPIAWTDGKGNVEFWNRRAQKLFGWSMDEIGRDGAIFTWFFPDPERRELERARWREAVGNARSAGRDVHHEAEVSAKDGSIRSIEVFGTVVSDKLILTFHDLTDRKKNEAHREELQAQLARAHKIESLGRLAGGVAHDLNNLLVPILGYSQMLAEDTKRDGHLHEGLVQIQEAAERARELTRQLLAFGRKQVLNFTIVDVSRAIGHFEKLLRRTIREDIRFELVAPGDLGTVRADVGQLEQVIMNLAVNAQQAMPDGGTLMIEVSDVEVGEHEDATTLAEVTPGPYVLIRVSDTGQGMDAAVLERAFEPFYTTKKSGEGTGLGLAIVHGIVKQHGGHIFVESKLGFGVTFRIYLPRVDGAVLTAESKGSVIERGARGGETILLAEDESAVREVVTRMLERLGYRVLVGRDVAHCLEIASRENESISLLLTDVVMPEMDGKHLYDELAKTRPGLKVLYMSGHPRDVLDRRGVAEEEPQFLAKPISSEHLAEAVRRALEAPARRSSP